MQLVLPNNLSFLSNDNGYLYSNSGAMTSFVAMVNKIGDTYVITFRGTDSAQRVGAGIHKRNE